MSDNLVIAKKEYTEQLLNSISPAIYAGFLSIFDKCRETDSPYKCFQKKLCDIPIWNQNIIETEHNRIIKHSKLEWLDMLIEAIFIVNVKILSSIKPTQKTLNIQLPDSKKFIHECYIHAAREYYVKPKTITMSHSDNIELIKVAINKTIIYLVPQKEVIESVLKAEPEEQVGESKYENTGASDTDEDNQSNLSLSDQESITGEDLLMDPKNIEATSEAGEEFAPETAMKPVSEPALTPENPEQETIKSIEMNETPQEQEPPQEPPRLETIPLQEENKKEEETFFFSDED